MLCFSTVTVVLGVADRAHAFQTVTVAVIPLGFELPHRGDDRRNPRHDLPPEAQQRKVDRPTTVGAVVGQCRCLEGLPSDVYAM